MRQAAVILAVCALAALTGTARKVNSTRRVTPVEAAGREGGGARGRCPAPGCDTIFDVTGVVIAGYDKPLRSRHETFFVTNNRTDTLLGLWFTVDYYTVDGRRLHSRTDSVCNVVIPPGDTRNCSISSWDRQQAFYYRLSQAPTRSQGSPYDVRFTLTKALVRNGKEERE